VVDYSLTQITGDATGSPTHVAGYTATFIIHFYDTTNTRITVDNFVVAANSTGPATPTLMGTKFPLAETQITIMATVGGVYFVSIFANDTELPGSPFQITYIPGMGFSASNFLFLLFFFLLPNFFFFSPSFSFQAPKTLPPATPMAQHFQPRQWQE
jgi:hypothetical protein